MPLFKPWFKQEPFCIKLKQAQTLLHLVEEKLIAKADLTDIKCSKENEHLYWNYWMLKKRVMIKAFWVDYSAAGSSNDRYVKNLIRALPDGVLFDNDAEKSVLN
ncbi:MAG: hypothetical protein J0I09_01235 [Sphingobacteriia bacterium]|nr:hypothetical protein [Sphingobacteriia bacterium]